jgi:hypothetical protein
MANPDDVKFGGSGKCSGVGFRFGDGDGQGYFPSSSDDRGVGSGSGPCSGDGTYFGGGYGLGSAAGCGAFGSSVSVGMGAAGLGGTDMDIRPAVAKTEAIENDVVFVIEGFRDAWWISRQAFCKNTFDYYFTREDAEPALAMKLLGCNG